MWCFFLQSLVLILHLLIVTSFLWVSGCCIVAFEKIGLALDDLIDGRFPCKIKSMVFSDRDFHDFDTIPKLPRRVLAPVRIFNQNVPLLMKSITVAIRFYFSFQKMSIPKRKRQTHFFHQIHGQPAPNPR